MTKSNEHPGNSITVSQTKEVIVVNIPIDLLVWTQENREGQTLKIINKKMMASYVKNRLLLSRYDTEQGTSAFERMLDELFDEAYEDGEVWLKEAQ